MLLVIIIVWFLLVIYMLIVNKKIGDRNKEFENDLEKNFTNDNNKEKVLM